MHTQNSVFIATSLDGFISDRNGGIDWLQTVPNPENNDIGYSQFMERIDALVMGRITYETVLNFGIEWPYTKPVFVLSQTLKDIPKELKGKVFIVKGPLKNVLNEIHEKGFYKLYIDGGSTIRSFLQEDLIDELILTTIPVLLGGGLPLFTELPHELKFELVECKVYLNQIVQSHYKRKGK